MARAPFLKAVVQSDRGLLLKPITTISIIWQPTATVWLPPIPLEAEVNYPSSQ